MSELATLLVVTQAKYDHQRQAFSKIVAEEMRLRAELQRLTEMNQQTEDQADHLQQMRVIGADLLWRGWLSRSKTALNMELARTLAIKEHEKDKVRKAFGKVVALEALIKEQIRKDKKARAKTALQLALTFSAQ